MTLNWRKIYETGIPKIDEQHQGLFDTLKKLYETPMHEKGLVLKSSMEELMNYATEHFETEEEYWKEINFPNDMIKQHKREHDLYIKEISLILRNNFQDGIFLSMNALDFLKDWIIDHVLGEDQEYVKWARENEVE